MTYNTREEWLQAFICEVEPMFDQFRCALPERIRVSCGWPLRARITGSAGQAWSVKASADGACETFISPIVSDPVEVGSILLHELIHHAVGVEKGHRGKFVKLATAFGLQGPMKVTTPGTALKLHLRGIADKLGPYPHAALKPSDFKRQSTRMLKVECPSCGCVVRMTRFWLDNVGPPLCGGGCGKMVEVVR